MNDVFISYAREDKDLAREIAQRFSKQGLSVWLDVQSLKVGDSVTGELGNAINTSRYGVLLISKNYLSKKWTMAELKLLFQKQMASGEKTILPIWHGVDLVDIGDKFPFLLDIQALSTNNMSVPQIVSEIMGVIKREKRTVIEESKIEKPKHQSPETNQSDTQTILKRSVLKKSLKRTVTDVG